MFFTRQNFEDACLKRILSLFLDIDKNKIMLYHGNKASGKISKKEKK
jgi:hypothetical protein